MYRHLVVIALVLFTLHSVDAGDDVVASANGDDNCDQTIDIADPVLLLNWLFVGGP